MFIELLNPREVQPSYDNQLSSFKINIFNCSDIFLLYILMQVINLD